MSSLYTNDLIGAGNAPFLPMAVETDADQDFTQDDLNSNLRACVITDNKTVGMGSDGDKLFGAVVWVSQSLVDGTTVPEQCSVQARGIARFKYVAPTPIVNAMVVVDGAGAVKLAPADADIAAGGHLARGIVVSVDTEAGTCDVWLG